jgi:asparagine synthase (glutamine-hydrolysing)
MRLLGDDFKHSGALISLWWLIRSAGLLSLPNFAINIARTFRDRFNGDNDDGQRWLTSALKQKLLIQQEKQTGQQPNQVRLPSQHNGLATLQDAYIARSHYINDRYAAGFELEARRPFYTVGMVQFSFMLPTRLQFSQGVDKYTHRRAMRGLLPNMVLERQTKAEFSTTFDHHLRQLRNHFADEIFDRRDDWINKDQAVRLLETYLSEQQPGLSMWLLWSLLVCDNIFDHRHVQR